MGQIVSNVSNCQKCSRKYFDKKLLNHIKSGENEEARKMIKSHKRCEQIERSSGRTLFHYAAKYGNANMMYYLLYKRCRIDVQDNEGYTPLMISVGNRFVDTTIILLEANAKMFLKDTQRSLLQMFFKSWDSWDEDDVELQTLMNVCFRRIRSHFSNNHQAMAEALFMAMCPLHLVVRFVMSGEVAKYYLDMRYPVNKRDHSTQRTALHVAVESENLEAVEVLLEHGADVNAMDDYRRVPLCYYNIKTDDTDTKLAILRNLLNYGASLSTPYPNSGYSIGVYLLIRGKLSTARAMLQSVDRWTWYDEFGMSVLHLLIRYADIDLIKQLEPLLFQENNIIDDRDRHGWTALMSAIVYGNYDKVKFLLEHGAEIDIENQHGYTALRILICRCRQTPVLEEHLRCVELFLQHGADVQRECKDGTTIFDNILKVGPFGATDFLVRQSAIVNLLLSHLVLIEARGKLISNTVLNAINSNDTFIQYLESAKQQLQDMKSIVLQGFLTIYKLLTERDEQITLYARGDDFLPTYLNAMDNNVINEYYVKLIRERVQRAVYRADRKKRVAFLIFEMTGLSDPTIVDVIIDYLDDDDMENLLSLY